MRKASISHGIYLFVYTESGGISWTDCSLVNGVDFLCTYFVPYDPYIKD